MKCKVIFNESSGPGGGPFPAVLDLHVLGILSEKRAALLASGGFVVLTVALCGYDDMPKNIEEFHLDYFEEAIEFLKTRNKVSSDIKASIYIICPEFKGSFKNLDGYVVRCS